MAVSAWRSPLFEVRFLELGPLKAVCEYIRF